VCMAFGLEPVDSAFQDVGALYCSNLINFKTSSNFPSNDLKFVCDFMFTLELWALGYETCHPLGVRE
jgi:hypothetical protein